MAARSGESVIDERGARPAVRDDGEMLPGVRPVAHAYEQIADQLRAMIVTGRLADGERLPSEATLAGAFSVSRATVREGLRLLAAQNLIRTSKGRDGGSFVSLPTIEYVSETLGSGIGLLAQAEQVTVDQLLEVRELLEVPAAGLAALRSGRERLGALDALHAGDEAVLDAHNDFARNAAFHATVIKASENALLELAARPIFEILQARLLLSSLPGTFTASVAEQHAVIADAISCGNQEAAETAMREHLRFIRPYYRGLAER
ncbi:MAG TPA: FCD domain-containing protein [Gaiellaceae bacterium]|nr:FCD domain-containing protein [Gaiellaceae bacterium]